MKNRIMESWEQFYDNCVYSSVAHAISLLQDPFFSCAQSWDGMNYSFQDGSARGTVSFDLSGNTLTGAARDETSTRRKWYPDFKAISLFDQAPEKNRMLAKNETLEYLYDEEGGMVQPMATIAFWNEGNEVYTNDEVSSFKVHGGEYIMEISENHDALREYWREQYALKQEEISAIDYIFTCLKGNKVIKKKQLPLIHEQCEGYHECLVSLSELGIRIV